MRQRAQALQLAVAARINVPAQRHGWGGEAMLPLLASLALPRLALVAHLMGSSSTATAARLRLNSALRSRVRASIACRREGGGGG